MAGTSKEEQEAAARAVFFMESLKLAEGQWGGQYMKLLDWQRMATEDIYGTFNPDGYRQYRRAYIEIAKKNGKTPFGGGNGLKLTFDDGEFGALVFVAATDREQASLVYGAAEFMRDTSPELARRSVVYQSTKSIYVPATKSSFKVVSKETRSKHGPNLSGLIFDELHAQPNRDLYDVLTKGSAAARLQPLFIYITTAGNNINSICYELHEYALRVLKHRYPEEYSWVTQDPIDDPTFYAMVHCLKPDDDWEDERNWYKANPALGKILRLEELRQAYKDAKQNLAEENIFKQLRLNIWVKQATRWMKMEDWDECGKTFDVNELKGLPCYCGLDLSYSGDLTAMSLIFPRGDYYDILMRFWIPADVAEEKEKRDHVPYRQWARNGLITMTPGNVVDYRYIRKEINELRQIFDIRELAYDAWGASKLIQDLEEDGFVNNEKDAGSGHPLIVRFGQGYKSMSPPTKDLMILIRNKDIRHGGNPVLRWNVDNLVIIQDPAGNIKPDKAKATQRIDGAVAMIMGIDRAIKHAPEMEPSVYETRGVRSF